MADYRPHRGQRIERIYAWVAQEPDGGEGLLAAQTVDGEWAPLIGADMARVESFRSIARHVELVSGQPVSLVCYTSREDLEGPAGQTQS